MLVQGLVVLVALSATFRLWPSVLNPVLWKTPNVLPTLEGPSASNNLLQKVSKIEGNFAGPESLAIDPDSGLVYASFNDGTVGSFSPTGEYLERVAFIGKEVANLDPSAAAGLFEWCNTEALSKRLAWNVEGERKCGRPLGLRIRKDANGHNQLYILDAYHGLFVLNLHTKALSHWFGPNTPITSEGHQGNPNAHAVPRFYNDLDILEDGRIVFTDSSYLYARSENRKELLDGAGRGRLLVFNPTTASISVRLCGLHFPNGVQLINEKDVLVGELARFRILQVDMDGLPACSFAEDGAGSLEQTIQLQHGVTIFADSVPGLVDNIRSHKGLFTVGLGSKSTKPFSLLWFCYQNLLLRDLIGRFVSMKLVEKLVPKYGLVVAYDRSGRMAGSLHDPKGQAISFISQADIHPHTGDMWLGSHSEAFVGLLKASDVPDWLK